MKQRDCFISYDTMHASFLEVQQCASRSAQIDFTQAEMLAQLLSGFGKEMVKKQKMKWRV